MSALLKVKNLYKVFGNKPEAALDLIHQGYDKNTIFKKTGQAVGVCDASFEVFEGEIFVVMGLSGSGKSTLVRLLNRLIEPTTGEILIQGKDITKMNHQELINMRRRDMSMVFQSFALMPHQTVIQNAAFGLEVAGIEKVDRHERALKALAQVGLEAYANSYPDELSGGMKQRVGLARALANDPSILLMDEAFSALDPIIRTEMQDELINLQQASQRTVIFISHDLDEAIRIGDRIAVMEGGRIVQIGTPEEILRHPADDYVQSFFRSVDISQVLTAGDIARNEQVTVIDRHDHGLRSAARRLAEFDREFGYVIDKSRHYHGVVSADRLKLVLTDEKANISDAFIANVQPIAADTMISDTLAQVAQSSIPLPVVNDKGIYVGTLSKSVLLEALDRSADSTSGTENIAETAS